MRQRFNLASHLPNLENPGPGHCCWEGKITSRVPMYVSFCREYISPQVSQYMSSFSPTSMCKKSRLWEALVARTRWEKWESGFPLNLRDVGWIQKHFFPLPSSTNRKWTCSSGKAPSLKSIEKHLSFDGWKLGCSRYKLQSRYDVFLPSSKLIVAPRRNAPTASNKPL